MAAEAEVQQLQASLESTNELLRKAMEAARTVEADAAKTTAAAQAEVDAAKARLAEAAGVLNAKEELREAKCVCLLHVCVCVRVCERARPRASAPVASAPRGCIKLSCVAAAAASCVVGAERHQSGTPGGGLAQLCTCKS